VAVTLCGGDKTQVALTIYGPAQGHAPNVATRPFPLTSESPLSRKSSSLDRLQISRGSLAADPTAPRTSLCLRISDLSAVKHQVLRCCFRLPVCWAQNLPGCWRAVIFSLRGCHSLWPVFPDCSDKCCLGNSMGPFRPALASGAYEFSAR
jgi:hypothetical protein